MEVLEQDLSYETNTQSYLANEHYDVALLENQARYLIETHGQIEHDHWSAEPEINARTALFEELTAKGHLSRVEYDCDVDTANRQTLARLLNGYSNYLPIWEQNRRFREIVEELLIHRVWQDVRTGIASPDTIVLTLSDYAEEASPDIAHQIGYRYLNKKGMNRGTHFEVGPDGQWRRVVEQISRSNSTDQSSGLFLANEVGCTEDVSGSTQRLGKQALVSRHRFPNGVVDVQRFLDFYAGPNIRYGEDISRTSLYLPDYDQLRRVSCQRETQLERYIDRLADFERGLNVRYHAGQITYNQKLGELYQKRTELINEICLLDTSYAHDARGELSGKYFEKAAVAMASGDHSTGQQHLESALRSIDPRAAVVCGGNGVNNVATQAVSSDAKKIYSNALEERKHWKWQKGFCVVKDCQDKYKRVEVGPCSVCRKCQAIFDGEKEPRPEPDFFDLISESVAQIDYELKQKSELKRQKQEIIKLEKRRRARIAAEHERDYKKAA